jgi:hypothetical protein
MPSVEEREVSKPCPIEHLSSITLHVIRNRLIWSKKKLDESQNA